MGKGQDLYKKAQKLIPGGSQLLSKKPEKTLPELWPAYFDSAKGCEVIDLDGNRYLDMGHMSVGTCILGYADDDVNKAVKDVVDRGNMSSLNPPEEVELAEVLCGLHPWADMARFTRSGGEAVSVAVRIARAKTGRDKVLFCGYHGWHDWYLAANLSDMDSLGGHLMPGLSHLGVPKGLKGTAYPFNYNDRDGFLKLIEEHRESIGAVVMEPIRNYQPEKGFLEIIRSITRELEIIFIFDEITAGWRLTEGGAHLLFGIEPDMAVFGKAMSNGFPMAAVIGRRDVMNVAEDTFISSTYWTDRVGPAASLATIKKIREKNVLKHLSDTGRMIQDGWRLAAEMNGLDIDIAGIYPLSSFSFRYKEPQALTTLFTQLMLEKGFLAATSFYASYAHDEVSVRKYLEAVGEAFKFISAAIKEGDPRKYLKGPVCQTGFKRFA
ncbi:MAG: aminotransferase class III-fold pyridoxal phosphate-dependent enzyme [Nitrospirae bacterium]|nr:aminotransferase class III-fold pyridoxal phosphate-dependent enzyme [Nitrospirota bacterium]